MTILIILGIILVIGTIASFIIFKFSKVTGKFDNAIRNIIILSWDITGLGVGFGLSGCKTSTLTPLFGDLMLPAFINEALLCLLMLLKAWKTYTTSCRSALLDIIIKDRWALEITKGLCI
jgi:hypothetical protein